MKKFKLLPIVLFASAITLASCNFLGGSSSSKKKSKKSSTGDTTQVTSGDSSSSKSSSSGGKSSSSGGSSSGGSSSSSSSGSSSTSGGGQSQYTALGIMQAVGTSAWGSVEDGDFTDPDADGVVESNYTIGLDISNPEDSETCLNGALSSLVAGILEDVTYLSIAQGPTYQANAITSVTPALGVSVIYLITDDYEFIVYMYDYCYNGSVSTVFMCGPYDAFAN